MIKLRSYTILKNVFWTVGRMATKFSNDEFLMTRQMFGVFITDMEKTFDSFENYGFLTEVDESNVRNEDLISELCQLTGDLGSWKAERPIVTGQSSSQGMTETFTKLKDPPDVKEILNADESSIAPTTHNVGVINAACQEILNEMEQQLLFLLKKNKKEQETVENYLSANGKSTSFDAVKKPCLKCLGMPYFKDSEGYPPPLNQDVLSKKSNNKLLAADFIEGPSMWGSKEVKSLMKAVDKQLASLNDSGGIDWMKISATNMNGKYSPSECKSKWMMNLRPDIKKSRWTQKENKALEKVAEKHNFQDWDKIAEELGSNRTGFQCCVQYQTRRAPKEGKWTKEEDEKLKKIMEKHRVKDFIPWSKIVWHFEQRSLRQCQERYAYHLTNIKKGGFTPEEDFVLVYLAKKLSNFGEVARYFPKRVSTQLRARYEYLVKTWMPEFSREEDELLMSLMAAYPRDWDKISEAFKNRSKLQCRGRWASIQKEIKLEKDVSDDETEEGFEFGGKETRERKSKGDVDLTSIKKDIKHLSKLEENVRARVRRTPKEYDRLLEYHKHCYKFLFGPKPRICNDPVETQKLAGKLRVSMSKLSAGSSLLNIDSLSSNCEFDEEDVAVLSQIEKANDQEKRKVLLSDKVIPPNYVTLVGVRTLLLAWNNIRTLCEFYKGRDDERREVDPEDRILFSDAKKLFKCRMKALFTFPLIMSNISTRQIETKPVVKPKVRRAVKAMSKRRRKQHAKYMREMYSRKLEKELEEELRVNGDEPETGNQSLAGEETEKEECKRKRKNEAPVQKGPKRSRRNSPGDEDPIVV